jgi:predicted nucleic acid-binding Zn ribbon protein
MAKREILERPVPVKELLERFLKPGDWQALRQRRLIREVWERVLPASLVEQTRLADVRRKELWVEVSGGPWVQELQFLKPKILLELERVLGQGVIRDVRFSIGCQGR